MMNSDRQKGFRVFESVFSEKGVALSRWRVVWVSARRFEQVRHLPAAWCRAVSRPEVDEMRIKPEIEIRLTSRVVAR